MAKFDSAKIEKDAVLMAASLMAAAVRTAPKAKGHDDIKTMVLEGQDLESLAQAVEKKAPKPESFFIRDANNLRKSACVLLIGVSGKNKGLDCGACGYSTCRELQDVREKALKTGKDFTGPNCVFQAIDLGIALGSAAKLASELSIDNRMMYTIGAAAKAQGLLDSDVIIGIPLSVSGKNPYFDRK